MTYNSTEMMTEIDPKSVVPSLKKHLLIDGFDLVFDLEQSKGSYFHDAAHDRRLLDMYAFYASLPIGFNHPHFDDPAVREDLTYAARVKTANSDVYSPQFAEFVQTFERVAGIPELDKYFFVSGGALAVENALKAAMDWKVRKNMAAGRGSFGTQIMHFKNAFHGRSGYTMSLTNTDPKKTDLYAKFDWPRIVNPRIDFSIDEPARTQQTIAGEQEAERQMVDYLSRFPHQAAAVIIEPIQGEGGDRHFRREWFHKLRDLCDRHEMLLIFDEVQTGLGATGKTWCCQHFDVLPDILVFGKKVQVCGIMAGRRLDEVPDNVFRVSSRINSTWGGNLVDMVRSTHYLRIIERENLVENAARMGERFLKKLHALADEEPMISAVRGRGLLLAFSFDDRATRDRFWKTCYEVGLLTIRCGERSIRLRPVLDVTPDVIDEAMRMMRDACRLLRRAAGA